VSKRTTGTEDSGFTSFLNEHLDIEITRDKEVRVSTPDGSAILEYVMENFTVDEVFDSPLIDEWLRDNGYIKAEE